MLKRPAALGFRVHSGWAAMVAISGPVVRPVVVLRRRIELIVGGWKQPYHEAEPMTLNEASAHIDACATAAFAATEKSMRDALAELTAHDVKNACILTASGRPLPDLPAILRSHALIHTAEGEFFRSAVRQACNSCGLPHRQVKERELWTEAERQLDQPRQGLRAAVDAFRKDLGPPWQQDHKLAALAAWLTLAQQGRLTPGTSDL
jgi:hypothetical protein